MFFLDFGVAYRLLGNSVAPSPNFQEQFLEMSVHMAKFFGILLFLFGATCFANDSASTETEEQLYNTVNVTLDKAVRCSIYLNPIGNAASSLLGKEIAVWSKKRDIRNNHILPLLKKAKNFKDDLDAQTKITVEVVQFREVLLQRPSFQRCPEKVEEFFKSVEKYIEVITAI